MSEPTIRRPRTSGAGRTLVAFYGVMTLAALARSIVQLISEFGAAPLAISLSFVAGVVYLVALVALIRPGRRAYLTAVGAITFELVGVVAVGTLSLLMPDVFPFRYTVWWGYGIGYVLLPLALPVLGLLFLRSQRDVFVRDA